MQSERLCENNIVELVTLGKTQKDASRCWMTSAGHDVMHFRTGLRTGSRARLQLTAWDIISRSHPAQLLSTPASIRYDFI